MLPSRPVYDEEHRLFRDAVRRFIRTEILPHFDAWEERGIVDRSFWARSGAAGILCPQISDDYGGAGGTFKHNAVVIEEFAYAGLAVTSHDDTQLNASTFDNVTVP